MIEENNVEFGSVQIHKKAIADIAYSAISHMDDIALIPVSLTDRMLEFFGKKSYSGISVAIDKDNQVSIKVKVLVKYGVDITDVARRVQEMIRQGIEGMTDINLKNINVDIQGVKKEIRGQMPPTEGPVIS